MGNNPVNFSDPTGHKACDGEFQGDCKHIPAHGSYGTSFDGDFSSRQRENIMDAVKDVASALWINSTYETPWAAFRAVYDSLEFGRCGQGKYVAFECTAFGWTLGRDVILFGGFYMSDELNTKLTVHELGHAFDSYVSQTSTSSVRQDFEGKLHGCTPTIADGGDCLGRSSYTNPDDPGNPFWGFAGGLSDWQFAVQNIDQSNEIFADMFVGWVYSAWGPGIGGENRRTYMDTMMPSYLISD